MVRITAKEEIEQTTITIDGELCGQHVKTLATCCRDAKSNGKPVQVFLRAVTNVDQGGLVLLRSLVREGFCLIADGVYTSYLVHELISSDAKSPDTFKRNR